MRNKSVRTIVVLLIVSLMLSVMAFSAFATETEVQKTTQDGLEFTLETDSASYTATQDITVKVTVKNTNEHEMTGLNIETVFPEGYTVKSTDGKTTIKKIIPNGTVKLTVVLASDYVEEPQPEKDNTWIWVAVIAAVVILLGVLVFCLRGKLKTLFHIVSIVLVFATVLTVGMLQAEATDAETKPSMSLTKTVNVNGENKEIQAKVSYDEYVAPPEEEDKTFFYTGFDTEKSINSFLSHGTVQLQQHNTAKGTAAWCAEEGNEKPGCALFDMESVGAKKGDIQWNFNYMLQTGENLIEAGKEYEISFYAKLEGTEVIPVTTIVFRDLNDNAIRYSSVATTEITGDQWAKYTVTLTVNESRNVAKLMFQAGGNEATNVKLYIDDITIQDK